MLKYILIVSFIFSFGICFSQVNSQDIKMISEYGTKNKELANLLFFQNIDFYKVKFVGNRLNNFKILAKEIWDGEIKKIDTLINTSKIQGWKSESEFDTLSLTIIASKVDSSKLKIFFRFPTFAVVRKFNAINSDDYSFRIIGSNSYIKKNEFSPVFAYILPYIEENIKMYCAVDQSGIDVYNWGKKFNIPHYIVFEIKFED
ncbi:hypothetical protein ABRY23_10880 [Melioribacteraceae bacterium 4301-Me]|uniref:hypothetical protein n=1 Tax=Pyranulibacter aquaticus TaxID=3163344 RepID=UPI00359BE844